jgi:hypothetical protein
MTALTTPTIHLGVPTQVGGLTIFPVWTDQPQPRRATLAELPTAAVITELDGGPSVSSVQLANSTDLTFVLLEGTLFAGGWQHRVLTHSVLVGAHANLVLDVRCVEQGRWDGEATKRVDSRRAPLAVWGALRGLGGARPPHGTCRPMQRADQGDVWRRVDSYQRIYGPSPTGSLVDVIDAVDARHHAEQLIPEALPGQRGVLIGIGGHPVILEVFDHPRAFARQWHRTIRGLLVDALRSRPVSTPGWRARAFAHRASRRHLEPCAPAGSGVLAEISDDLIDARGLHDGGGRLIHAASVNVRHDALVAA